MQNLLGTRARSKLFLSQSINKESQMAWIAVHEEVPKHQKFRDLYKNIGCNEFEALGILVSVWQWGLYNATPDGIIRNADKDDISCCLRRASVKSKHDADKIVEALIKSGWIDEDGDTLIIHDWGYWQGAWFKALERREKDKARKQRNKESHDTEGTTELQAEVAIPEEQPKPEPKAQSSKTLREYSPTFEAFWKAYPRHKEKSGAYRAYQARIKDGFSAEEMIEAATAYANDCVKKHTEEQYIKLAATFIGPATPFLDYLKKDKPQPEMQNGLFTEWGEM